MMGDTVLRSENSMTVKLHAEGLRAGDRVKLISNLGVEKEFTLAESDTVGLQASPEGKSESNLEAVVAGRAFYRAEVWRHFTEVDRTLMAAVTNPIYFE
jgi:hypothetical protein